MTTYEKLFVMWMINAFLFAGALIWSFTLPALVPVGMLQLMIMTNIVFTIMLGVSNLFRK